MTEEQIVGLLKQVLPRRWPIIVHPDAIIDLSLWSALAEWLCALNMDKRKPTGRTVAELSVIFQRLPQASFC